jgi:uncharacterized membrane protein
VKTNPDRLESLLAKVMLTGVLIAAGVMLAGGMIFLIHHGGDPVRDHIFTGEPKDLREPKAILKDALRGHNASLIQAGVLLLLLNPILRVILSSVGYALQKDRLYAVISLIVLGVLLFSFFS